MQMNRVEVVVALLPVPDVAEEMPKISTESEALPPVQLIVSGELRFTEPGRPPVTVSGDARLSEALNDPTSGPPPPLRLYCPPGSEKLSCPGIENPSVV